MITIDDRDFLVAIIDLHKCVEENDIKLANELVKRVNVMELSDDCKSFLDSNLKSLCSLESIGSYDVIKILYENIDVMVSKSYYLNLLDVYNISRQTSEDQQAWLEETDFTELDLYKEPKNQLVYVKVLLHLCIMNRRFDKMEQIRAKLNEVV